MNFKKATLIMVALLLTVFMASSAMAYNLDARSEEMTANSNCDLAGTLTFTFTADDVTRITNHLATEEYVLLRVSLSGTDIDVGSDVPLLCRDIMGTQLGAGLGAQLGDLPDNLAVLDVADVEINAGATVTAYVLGTAGNQYFEIFITTVPTAGDWIKVGLYEEVIGAGDNASTAICADVHDFAGFAKLTVSIDNDPSELTTNTSDNQIGHFLAAGAFTIANCTKTQLAACPLVAPDTTIELCPIVAGAQAVFCPTYDACVTVTGNYPTSGDVDFVIRLNGSADGADAQNGVYFRALGLRDGGGGVIVPSAITYYMADGSTIVTPADCTLSGSTILFTMAEKVAFTVAASDITSAGNFIQFCITYLVDPMMAVAGTDVQMWMAASVVPCGELFNGVATAAALVECGTTPSCVYMPYVLTQTTPWNTGVVVTNLSSTVAAADMEVTFTLTDATGASFTYTKSDFTATMWAGYLDSILAEFSGTPAAGPAWLLVQANFTVDGYTFLTDGTFGAGTLPRPLASCLAVFPTP